MITVYGTAKNPAAPAPNISAGTATNVYAVYRSPPIRNHVIQPPKLRPPSPHSSRCSMSFGARHRAAMKPITLTRRNRNVKMMISVMCSLIRGSPRTLPGHPVDDRGGGDTHEDEEHLDPVERREAPQPGRVAVVYRGQQWQHDRDEQQPVPRAVVGSLGCGHHLGRLG